MKEIRLVPLRSSPNPSGTTGERKIIEGVPETEKEWLSKWYNSSYTDKELKAVCQVHQALDPEFLRRLLPVMNKFRLDANIVVHENCINPVDSADLESLGEKLVKMSLTQADAARTIAMIRTMAPVMLRF